MTPPLPPPAPNDDDHDDHDDDHVAAFLGLTPLDDPRTPLPRPTVDDLVAEAHAEEELAAQLYRVPPAPTVPPDPRPAVAAAEEHARADLLTQLDDVVARLDVVLDTARAVGWDVPASATDDLYGHLADLRSDLEEGP